MPTNKRRRLSKEEETSNILNCSLDCRNERKRSLSFKSKTLHQMKLTECREMSEEGCGCTVFPKEIWNKIFSYLHTKDLKKLTLACKAIKPIAIMLLWEQPRFRIPLSPRKLNSLKHLPIKHLHTCDLNIGESLTAARAFRQIFDEMPVLQQVHVWIDYHGRSEGSENISIKTLEVIAPYVTSIHTDAIYNLDGKSALVSQLTSLDLPRLSSLTVRMPLHSEFTIEDLILLNRLPITTLYMSSLKVENKEGFTIFYPQLDVLDEMRHLKEIVFDILGIDYNQVPALVEAQRRGVALVRDTLFEEFRKYYGYHLRAEVASIDFFIFVRSYERSGIFERQ